jgi:hypothetical protein
MVVSGGVGSHHDGHRASERGTSGSGWLDPTFDSWLHRHDSQWCEVFGSVTRKSGDSLAEMWH